MNIIEITPAQTGRMKELNQVGFQRIGKSTLYQHGPAIVDTHTDGSFDIEHDFDDGIWPDIVGIKLGHGYNGFSLVMLFRDGSPIERTTNGSGGGMWDKTQVPTPSEFLGKSMVQQLREAGFTRDELDEHIYRHKVEEDGHELDIIALIDDGKIQKVLKPLDDSIRRKLTPATRILKCSSAKADIGNYMVSTYTLQDETMQYQVTDQYSGWLVQGSQKLIRSVEPEALGIETFKIFTEPSGFRIGGVNDEKLILGLRELAGQSITKLETRMRPARDSMAGFLGQNESLLKVLAQDNNFVHGNGLTHQELAFPLLYARQHYNNGYGNDFQLNGNRFHVDMVGYRGMQESPFDDETAASQDMTITNVDTDKKLHCSALLPDMILRYGFYEGKETPYRLEPSAIIKVFDFLKK
jgi:hypothetical protein